MASEPRDESLRLMLRQLSVSESAPAGERKPGLLRNRLRAGAALADRALLQARIAQPLVSVLAGRSRQWASTLRARYFTAAGLTRSPAGVTSAAGLSTAESLRRHIRASLVATGILVVGVGGWGATAEFAGAVIAPGSVVVDGNVKKLQHPTGGVVDELRVKDGDQVRSGDVLIRLDRTQSAVNLAIISKSLDELLVRQARLEAEREGLEAVNFPIDLQARALEDADLGKIITGERRLFDTRRTSRLGQQLQLQERIAQLQEQILGLDEQIGAKKREMKLIERELGGVQELFKKNLVAIQRVTTLERDAARIEGEHGSMISAIAQTKARITETKLQILQVDQDLRAEVGRELAEIRSKTAELLERKISAEDHLRRIDIRAPMDGTVHQLTVHTVGGVIAAGEALMLIVPDSDDLSVEVRLPPDRIDQVRKGQSALLRFSAFNQRTTPEVRGEVTLVSADLLKDQRTGVEYYIARISLSPGQMGRLGQKLLPGMPVEAFIHTGDRTVLSYLTKPFTDQMRRAFRER